MNLDYTYVSVKFPESNTEYAYRNYSMDLIPGDIVKVEGNNKPATVVRNDVKLDYILNVIKKNIPNKKVISVKRDVIVKKKLNSPINANLLKRLKLKATLENKYLYEVVEEAVKQYLEK